MITCFQCPSASLEASKALRHTSESHTPMLTLTHPVTTRLLIRDTLIMLIKFEELAMQVVCPLWSVSGFHLEMRNAPHMQKAKSKTKSETLRHAKRHTDFHTVPLRRDALDVFLLHSMPPRQDVLHLQQKCCFKWRNDTDVKRSLPRHPKLQSHRIAPSCFQFRKKSKSQVLSMVVSCQFAETMQQCHDKI